jgi:hypothetical protein
VHHPFWYIFTVRIRRIFCPPSPGHLSSFGFGLSNISLLSPYPFLYGTDHIHPACLPMPSGQPQIPLLPTVTPFQLPDRSQLSMSDALIPCVRLKGTLKKDSSPFCTIPSCLAVSSALVPSLSVLFELLSIQFRASPQPFDIHTIAYPSPSCTPFQTAKWATES